MVIGRPGAGQTASSSSRVPYTQRVRYNKGLEWSWYLVSPPFICKVFPLLSVLTPCALESHSRLSSPNITCFVFFGPLTLLKLSKCISLVTILVQRLVIERYAKEDPACVKALEDLSHSLRDKFLKQGEITDLQEAIALTRDVPERRPSFSRPDIRTVTSVFTVSRFASETNPGSPRM